MLKKKVLYNAIWKSSKFFRPVQYFPIPPLTSPERFLKLCCLISGSLVTFQNWEKWWMITSPRRHCIPVTGFQTQIFNKILQMIYPVTELLITGHQLWLPSTRGFQLQVAYYRIIYRILPTESQLYYLSYKIILESFKWRSVVVHLLWVFSYRIPVTVFIYRMHFLSNQFKHNIYKKLNVFISWWYLFIKSMNHNLT